MNKLFALFSLIIYSGFHNTLCDSFVLFDTKTMTQLEMNHKNTRNVLFNKMSKQSTELIATEIIDGKNMTYENFPGVIPPLGFWDPLSLTNSMKKDTFNYVREAELHHGRIAMTSMAILPILDYVNEKELAINIYNKYEDTVLAQIAFCTMLMYEVCRIAIQYESPMVKMFSLKQNVLPGNLFNNTKLTLNEQNKELSNGRLAMVGVLSYMLQELVTHNKV